MTIEWNKNREDYCYTIIQSSIQVVKIIDLYGTYFMHITIDLISPKTL